MGASTRMFELLDREPSIPLRRDEPAAAAGAAAAAGGGGGGGSEEPLQGHVALENVCFAYPSRPDVEVLKGVSLTVRPNQTVALVGQR